IHRNSFIIDGANANTKGGANMRKISRLFALLFLILIIAACSSDSSGNGEEDAVNNGDDGSSEGESGKVEIFSWWTGAGEEEGLLALIDLFEEKHPDITVENAAVAGGAGTNAKAVLATRMEGNDPPSTFQVHGGEELNKS